jgi:ribosomal protein L40E
MRDLVVEKALFLKREKRRFIAANPEVCERCGSRHPTPASLQRHKTASKTVIRSA